MVLCDQVLIREIPVILQIIRDETWLEGERRGCRVPAHDRVVRDNVCRVVLRIGKQLRDSVERQLANPALVVAPVLGGPRAAAPLGFQDR